MLIGVICDSDLIILISYMDVCCYDTPFILICFLCINIGRHMFYSHILFMLIHLLVWSHDLFIFSIYIYTYFTFTRIGYLFTVIFYVSFILCISPIEYVCFVMPPRPNVEPAPRWVVDLTIIIQRHIHICPFMAVVPTRSVAAAVSLPCAVHMRRVCV